MTRTVTELERAAPQTFWESIKAFKYER